MTGTGDPGYLSEIEGDVLQTQDLVNLQHHVIREKKLAEKETLVIFYNVIQVCQFSILTTVMFSLVLRRKKKYPELFMFRLWKDFIRRILCTGEIFKSYHTSKHLTGNIQLCIL
jgi:hypothetical protein